MWSWVEKEEGKTKEFFSDQGVSTFLRSRPSSGMCYGYRVKCEELPLFESGDFLKKYSLQPGKDLTESISCIKKLDS